MMMRRYELGWRIAAAAIVLLCGWYSIVCAAGQDELIAVLESDAPLFEKTRACEQLSIVGDDDAVAPLAALLGDEQLGDYARFALEPMAGPKVDTAFRAALGKLNGRLLAGVINSVGVRGDAEAVPALTAIARDPRSDVRAAAIAALGQIATDDAVRTIRGMLKDKSDQVRLAAADACLVAADRLAERRQARDAAKVYDAVGKADVPAHVQAAGVYGAIMTGGDGAASLLIAQLGSGDPVRLAVALRAARELAGDGVTEKLVKFLERAKPELQALMVGALADRGDAGAYASIKTLAAGADPTVRLEAIGVLGQIGDASAVPVLVTLVGGDGPEAQAAVVALRELEADYVGAAIVEALKTAQGDEQVALIEILTGRATKEARPSLLEAARSADADVAVAAFKGLTVLADGADTLALVELLVGLRTEAARGYAENAVVAAAGRIADQAARADAVLEKLNSAQGEMASASLLRVAGRIANAKAFEPIESAAASQDPTIRDIAIRALAAWPDGRALERLAEIAQDSSNATHRVLALRGHVRLLASETTLSAGERVAKYERAMALARSDADRKMVLAALANAGHPDALPIAMACVDDPAVKDEAMLAALKIAQSTAGARPEAARAAALEIAAQASSPRMRDQAKTLADTIARFADYIVGWQVAGPYMRENMGYQQLFKTPIGPEADEPGVTWSVMPAGTDPKRPWVLDLLKLWPQEQRVAYARTWVKSDKATGAVLETGSDDGIKVWVNGKLVQAVDAARAVVPASEKAKITLRAGWNRLLVKVTQNNSEWGFCMRIAAADGSRLEGIEVDCLHEPESRAVSVFDGRTFDGWEGNMDIFRIEDGAIVGGTLDRRIVRNEFLCTEREYGDFELRLKVRLLGDAGSANAGIQIRSRRIPNHHEMIGYQADMGQHYWGALYDESRRRKVLAGPTPELVAKAVKLGQWNDYVIRCEGKRIRLWINGHNTVDYTEPDDGIEQIGLIGLQIHSGAPSESWYKDITIEDL